MPQPTLSDVHVNVPLTNLSLAFIQEESAFVAGRVFPVVPVQKASDRYYIYTRGDWNRNSFRKRAPGAESEGSGYTLDNTPSYSVDDWALHKDIPDQIRANSDAVLNPDMEASRFLATQYLISREVNWAAAFFATGVYNTQATGTSTGTTQATGIVAGTSGGFLQWNDPSSTPIEDIRKVKQLVQLQGGGFRPNKGVISRQGYDVLCDHPDIIDRLKYGQTAPRPAQVTKEGLAALMELDELLVMDSIINNAVEGTTESNGFIASRGMLLTYTPAAPGLMTPATGYTFTWTGMYGGTTEGTRIKSFYETRLASTRVEMDAAYALKLVSADLGGFLASVVA